MADFSDFEKIAVYTGGLIAAAKHDLAAADPADVGLNGVPIVGWRQAYLDGIRDMANGVFTNAPEDIREQFGQAARDAHDAETKSLSSHNREGSK